MDTRTWSLAPSNKSLCKAISLGTRRTSDALWNSRKPTGSTKAKKVKKSKEVKKKAKEGEAKEEGDE
ncbi:unnamed protein product, partial [Nesidiocoris tenuis]